MTDTSAFRKRVTFRVHKGDVLYTVTDDRLPIPRIGERVSAFEDENGTKIMHDYRVVDVYHIPHRLHCVIFLKKVK